MRGAARDLNRGLRVPQCPLTLYLEVSNVWNYKCAFCGSALNPKRFSMLKQADRGFFDLEEGTDNLAELIQNAPTVYFVWLRRTDHTSAVPRARTLCRRVRDAGRIRYDGFNVEKALHASLSNNVYALST
jgi:hypothetical protein